MTVTKYEDVVGITSRCRVRGLYQWWWTVRGTDDILYATFETRDPPRPVREQAVINAYSSPTRAVAVTSSGTNQIPWVSPFEPPFAAPSELPTIPRTDLSVVKRIDWGVDLVEWKGQKYIHKYMTVLSAFHSFETEIKNHSTLVLSIHIPKLISVVTHQGENRGLLIQFIDAPTIDDVPLTIAEKYSMTRKILEAITDLEKHGYYPQDLKCSNLILDKHGHLWVIDLGAGLTPGMYRPENERKVLRCEMEAWDMLYNLGRTVWELWDGEFPRDLRVPTEGMLPPVIGELVRECCSEVDPKLQVVDIWGKYQNRLEVTDDGFHEQSAVGTLQG